MKDLVPPAKRRFFANFIEIPMPALRAWHPRMDKNEQVAVSKGHMATQTSFPRRRESRLLHLGIQTKRQKSKGGLAVLGGITALGAMTPGFRLPPE